MLLKHIGNCGTRVWRDEGALFVYVVADWICYWHHHLKFEVYLKWTWLNQNIQQIPRDTDAEQQWQTSSCHSRHSKSSGNKWLKGFKTIRKDCQARQISGPVPEGPRHAWLQLISNTVIFPGQALRDACLCLGGCMQLLPSTPALWFTWRCIWFKQRVCLAQFLPPAEP